MATNKAFNLLTSKEKALFSSLDTPVKLQDFLENKIGYNLEEQGETCYSPRLVLRHRKANCVEGAIFAAAVLYYHGNPPLLGQRFQGQALMTTMSLPFTEKWPHRRGLKDQIPLSRIQGAHTQEPEGTHPLLLLNATTATAAGNP
jgi:hypothetical protein